MTTTTLAHIADLLREVGARDAFTARRTAPVDDLALEVVGEGRIRFPVSKAQAGRLCRLARPARYGKGEETLLDRRVRDTWEIPKSRVKIDRRRWNRTLGPVLEGLRADLGLADGSRLRAELHAMLVYGPGQFFERHQDSEKADAMVGTLVVTLPSAFTGGAFVVEHQGEKVTYRASPRNLSFVAFYADCHHEARPVKTGYRIVLTYNLMLEGGAAPAATADVAAPAIAGALAARLGEHFDTPLPPRWKDEASREAPARLAYLLDHQYTERGLGWSRLKGSDAARAAALGAAAERAGCEVVLALAEVRETWGCRDDWEPRWGRHRRWELDEDDEWESEDEDELPPDGPDRYTLEDLEAWSVELTRWIDPAGTEAEPIRTVVDEEEVCFTTPSKDLAPYASEHEGYMGNWGNTMDRWYRRGAIVLWPRARSFAVRAEASPTWALATLAERVRTAGAPAARELASSLSPFWSRVAGSEEGRGFFAKALRVARGLEDPTLAASLLRPFGVEALTAGPAKALATLVGRYGEPWGRDLLAGWSRSDAPRKRVAGRDRLAWLASLPRLADSLCAKDDGAGKATARLLIEDGWRHLSEEIRIRRGLQPPSWRDEAVAELVGAILAILEAAVVAEATALRDEVIVALSAIENETLVSGLVDLVRAGHDKVAPARRAAMGLEALASHCAGLLAARLQAPARRADDWSISLPSTCRCELCAELGAFLSDPTQTKLEWPLAKERRGHVHDRIDRHALPVRHETRRSGSPYTLVLEKTAELFEREAAERRRWQSDLEWLRRFLAGEKIRARPKGRL